MVEYGLLHVVESGTFWKEN